MTLEPHGLKSVASLSVDLSLSLEATKQEVTDCDALQCGLSALEIAMSTAEARNSRNEKPIHDRRAIGRQQRAERLLRPVALGRKKLVICRRDDGGERAPAKAMLAAAPPDIHLFGWSQCFSRRRLRSLCEQTLQVRGWHRPRV